MNIKSNYQEIYSIFQKEIEKEILNGEVSRAKFLSVLFLITCFFFCIFPIFVNEIYLATFGNKINPFVPPIFFGSISIYFFANSKMIQNWSNKNKPLPTFSRYINAIIETSIPSCALLYLGTIREPPIYVMLTPPVFVYFIFIFVSALQLNFKLSVFTGLIASVEYLTIATYFHFKSEGMYTEVFISNLPSHIAKTIFMFTSGIIVGFITSQIEKRLLN